MTSDNRDVFEMIPHPHPGQMVLEYLEFNGWSQRDLARRSGISPKTVSEICNGKAPITAQTALAFELVFQRPAHFWLNLQRQFDESEARQRQLAKSVKWEAWAQKFPLKEMRKRGYYVPKDASDVDSVLHFFGVTSPESWQSVWDSFRVAYRQTRKFEASLEAIAAWIREAELIARKVPLAEFDEQRLRLSLDEIRQLTRLRASEIMTPLQRICAKAGVAVVLVAELPRTRISGCARWLSDKHAMIGLTLRFKTDDQLWFTIFHEIGHLLLHRQKKSFVVDNAENDVGDNVVDPEMEKFETEANQFARDILIPPKLLARFIKQGIYTNDSIRDFAEAIGVGPGIVVGRLQHDGILQWHEGDAFKQKLRERIEEEE